MPEVSEGARGTPRLGRRLREARRRRGWTREALARAAGVSRTTLHHLEAGTTTRPRAGTLARLAAALELAPAELHALAETPPSAPDDAAAAFDRATNRAISEVFAAEPDLFAGWTGDDWDALYGTFGTGGRLSEEGVRHHAERINRNRETVARLRVVLETHLADVAERMVGALYEIVSLGPGEAATGACRTDFGGETVTG